MLQRMLSLLVLLCVIGGTVQAVPPATNYGNSTLNITSGTSRYMPQRRTVSPYIALAQNTGNLAFINYFTITRPSFAQIQINRQQGAALQQIQREVRADSQTIDTITGQQPISSTGHRAAFMTHRAYFGPSQANDKSSTTSR